MHEFDRCLAVDTDKKPVAEGFVRSFSSGTMEIKTTKDTLNGLLKGQPLQIHVYNASMGECIYSGEIHSAFMRRLQLTSVQLVINRQKRNNTRVNTELNYVFDSYADEKGTHLMETPVHTTILNVSANGVYLTCKERFDLGFRFSFTFRETARDIPVIAEIVRRELSPNGFRYGCQFVNISERDCNEIHQWVFQQQIELRRQQSY